MTSWTLCFLFVLGMDKKDLAGPPPLTEAGLGWTGKLNPKNVFRKKPGFQVLLGLLEQCRKTLYGMKGHDDSLRGYSRTGNI